MTKNRPFFSVIIPTLNEEFFLGKLLHSLSRQSFKDFEVIICDGRSYDATYKVYNKYRKKIKSLKWYTSKKRNVSYQRNRAAKYAKGKYLVFFDADVFIAKNHFLDLANFVIKNNSSFATTWIVPDNDSIIDHSWMTLWNVLVYTSQFTPKYLVSGHNIIVLREVFEKVGGFDPKTFMAEDHLFAQQVSKLGYRLDVVESLNQVMSLRRVNKEGRIGLGIKHSLSLYHILFKGPIYNKLFDYPMGGGHYELKKREKI